jgi:hypothetical protein
VTSKPMDNIAAQAPVDVMRGKNLGMAHSSA